MSDVGRYVFMRQLLFHPVSSRSSFGNYNWYRYKNFATGYWFSTSTCVALSALEYRRSRAEAYESGKSGHRTPGRIASMQPINKCKSRTSEHGISRRVSHLAINVRTNVSAVCMWRAARRGAFCRMSKNGLSPWGFRGCSLFAFMQIYNECIFSCCFLTCFHMTLPLGWC